MFSEKDKSQIENHGLTIDLITNQMNLIKKGMPYANLVKAATINNGILNYNSSEITEIIKKYDENSSKISLVKFVPASGAATRMFKFLHQFLNDYNENDIQSITQNSGNKELVTFLSQIEHQPFYEDVIQKTKETVPNFDTLSKNAQHIAFVKVMMQEDGLNFSFYPKGLLPFHKYSNHVATAFEEHLFEAALYASSNHIADLHFTVSEVHLQYFKKEYNRIIERVKDITHKDFNISYSFQKKSTDTIALTSDNQLYKDNNGDILFRPAGHGALLENLNELDNDVIFIKNIDNVVTEKHHQNISNYKKLLAGILIDVQEEVFKWARKLDTNNVADEEIDQIKSFLNDKLNVVFSNEFEGISKQLKWEYLKEKLNRPIRVCGMVKNVGEPGGGPFWVMDEKGNISLQIVESAQVDLNNENQKSILNNATHFNPVDLVCGVRNYKGNKYNLTEYVDYNAAFVASKTHSGNNIKALELPGLWNGSMAFWNTIFVEVPLSTFNPVKTVNDLLRETHQAL